jgi:hypothetical protein
MAKRAAPASIGFQTRDLMLPWLRFESRADIRALEPAPPGWTILSDGELEDLLGRSTRLKG